MKIFWIALRPAAVILVALTVLLGIFYPLAMTGFGRLFFEWQANGSLITYDGTIVGSEWIGQQFTHPHYFHPRPSRAGQKGYDAANSLASNWGPTSQKLADALKIRTAFFRQENGLGTDTLVAADAVTGSASGLDPHISVLNALQQSRRVASARGISQEAVQKLIAHCTEEPLWGVFGKQRVHILRLNLALDDLQKSQ
jgi:K+-transporting ATPase ATPase C chain